MEQNATSPRPVEVIEHYLAAVRAGREDDARAVLAAELVYVAPGANALAGVTTGAGAPGAWFGAMAARSGGTYRLDAVVDWLTDDDHAVLLAAESGLIDGREHRWTRAVAFDVPGPQITRVQLFEDDQHAYDAWVGGEAPSPGVVDPDEPAPAPGPPAMAGRLDDPRVQAVMAYQQDVAAGRLDAAREIFWPDVVYRVPGDSLLAGEYAGPDAVMGYLGRLMELTDGGYAISRMRWLTSTDRVGLLTRNHAERGSVRLSWDELIVFTFDEGRKRRIDHFSGDQAGVDRLFAR